MLSPIFSLPGSRVETPSSVRKQEKWPVNVPQPAVMVFRQVLLILVHGRVEVGFPPVLSSSGLA